MHVQIFSTLASMDMKDWILAARNYAQLNQTQLGERLGLSKGNISAWENGRHEASLDQLVRIAEITLFPEPLPGMGTGVAHRESCLNWPFPSVDEAKVRALNDTQLTQLETAILLGAAQLGLDIKKKDLI